ncbi:hypothetical protein G6F58_012920 [Rhizopus delemar]|nr:hypothetical protein G6F58_012920 [Rhizopus delemar]
MPFATIPPLTTRLALAVAMSIGLALPAFSAGAATPAASTNALEAYPCFADSPLPLHFPQFDRIKDSDFAPAFDAGMAQQLKEVEAIANNKAKPTFDNTIIALEKSGDILDRATTVFFSLVVRRAQRCDRAERHAVRAHPGAV